MGKQNVSDVLLESHGQCFLCLTHVSSDTPGSNEEEQNGKPAAVYSLQYVTHFLEMNLIKILSKQYPSQSNSRSKNEPTPRLNVELCDECVSLNKQFFELLRSLEKINMEMGSCLTKINRKLSITRKDARKTGQFHRTTGSETNLGSSKLEVVNILRAEALQKCSQKLRTFQPRVMLQKMTRVELNAEATSSNDSFMNKADYKTDQITSAKLPSLRKGGKSRRGRKQIRPWCINHRTGQYKCKLCSEEFRNYIQLYNHHNVDHQLPRGTYKKKSTIKIHDGKHGQKNKILAWNNEKVKIKLALGSKPGFRFHCQVCNRRFPRKDSLRRHHSNNVCGSAQILKHSFNHVCNHHNCGKEFSTENALRVHLRGVHLELRQHACNICGKSFNYKFNMQRHQRLIHKFEDRL